MITVGTYLLYAESRRRLPNKLFRMTGPPSADAVFIRSLSAKCNSVTQDAESPLNGTTAIAAANRTADYEIKLAVRFSSCYCNRGGNVTACSLFKLRQTCQLTRKTFVDRGWTVHRYKPECAANPVCSLHAKRSVS